MKIGNIGTFFTSDYKIGDRVIHRQTCFRGRVEGIEKSDGITWLTIKLDRGGVMNRIDRREFMLANMDKQAPLQPAQQEVHDTANEFLTKLDASDGISDASILDELV